MNSAGVWGVAQHEVGGKPLKSWVIRTLGIGGQDNRCLSLEKKGLWRWKIAAFKYVKGGYEARELKSFMWSSWE